MSRGSNYPAGGTPQSSQIIWFEQKVKEQEARIAVLERALVALDKDYERMKAAAQAAYRAMVAMELSDGSKREWDAAVSGLREALKGMEEKK